MNRYQIRRRVQGLLRDDSFPVEVINEALNRVLDDLNSSGRFRFQEDNATTITLVTGTYKYAVTSTILAEKLLVYQLASTTEQAIIPKGADMVDAIAAGAFTGSGVPLWYFKWDDYFWFDPIPSSAENGKIVTVFHYKDITQLTGDLDTPGIPARYHGNVLVFGTAAEIAPGLMVRTPEGNVMIGIAYAKARQQMIQQEKWEPFTNKQLIRDPRWSTIHGSGHVGKIR